MPPQLRLAGHGTILGMSDPHVIINPTILVPIRAAQYVRMSTDQQKYSIPNQVDAIADYAARRGFVIVRTYPDEARSGLHFETRPALKQLIHDVRNRQADYQAILVFDVSRWGRFQDVDESAYYEFICKEAGIRVHYCAEQFENDGSFASTMQKYMKRAMAGEYSRDLSYKVFMGQCRSVRMGFWVCGKPPMGLRRELVDENGRPKLIMEFNQRKNLRSDRVQIKLGPMAEVNAVRRIFQSFVEQRMTFTEIASALNSGRVFTQSGAGWNASTIKQVLVNEAYCGNIVFNRKSYKLSQSLVDNPPEMWIRHEGAFDAIVPKKIFARVQAMIERQNARLSDQDMLDKLTVLWRKKGHLNARIINSTKGTPHSTYYGKRFGSLSETYKLIGFPVRPRYCLSSARAWTRSTICEEAKRLVPLIRDAGGQVDFDAKSRRLTVGDAGIVDMVIARPPVARTQRSWETRWGDPRTTSPRSDLTLMLEIEAEGCAEVRHYYLIPTRIFELGMSGHNQRFTILNHTLAKQYRYDNPQTVALALASPVAVIEGGQINAGPIPA